MCFADSEFKCPKCGNIMEEVEFSMGSAAPDGEPGLLCHECGHTIGLDELEEENYEQI